MINVVFGMFIGLLIAVVSAALVCGFQSRQGWIAFDQWLHCLFMDDAMADETFSARCWREYIKTPFGTSEFRRWERWVTCLDVLFENGHCRDSYYAEMDRKHLPEAYRGQ